MNPDLYSMMDCLEQTIINDDAGLAGRWQRHGELLQTGDVTLDLEVIAKSVLRQVEREKNV